MDTERKLSVNKYLKIYIQKILPSSQVENKIRLEVKIFKAS